jgi:hypothetical protein
MHLYTFEIIMMAITHTGHPFFSEIYCDYHNDLPIISVNIMTDMSTIYIVNIEEHRLITANRKVVNADISRLVM